ncbi:hypothetical protein IMSAG049_00136 [Clostridiales bacterium]|nr:hypothetical protein IMSAG049_00136 [Clostridiales bacterium]
MINIRDKNYCPTLEEIGDYINNPIFVRFCSKIKNKYKCNEKIEFSSCSWENGWNIKFKRSGKTLCTIYPRENYFTVMVVIGKNEKESVDTILPNCNAELQDIYKRTKEGGGQRWLMIDLEDEGNMYFDVCHLIEIRSGRQR